RGGFSSRGWAYWIWPTRAAALPALLALLCRLPEDMVDLFAISMELRIRCVILPLSWSEVQELLIACFLLVYTMSLRRRLAREIA
ncbi:MAG: hypothetical protein ACTSRY_02995, partial [Alphaproteobacteria bacterium]